MKKHSKYLLVYLSVIVIFQFAISNTLTGQSREPISIEADSLVGASFTPSGHVRDWAGNVKISQKDVIIFCELARNFLEQNLAELTGNVRLLQENMVLNAPYIHYDGNTRIAKAPKGVEIVDDLWK